MTKEQLALCGMVAWLILSGISAVLVGVSKAMPSPPPWLVQAAKWSGVLAADVHKILGGDPPVLPLPANDTEVK